MGSPYVGEIRMFAGNFAPAGWALCQGQTMPISQNETLFNLIGTTYGGDGQSTFDLPNLSGRVPIHFGTNLGQTFQEGEMGGVESVTLTAQSTPVHNHSYIATTTAASSSTFKDLIYASNGSVALYTDPGVDPLNKSLNTQQILPVGGNQPHDNMMPFLCINFIISLFGIFPSPS